MLNLRTNVFKLVYEDEPPTAPPAPPTEKTFTQAELDSIVKDRLAKEQKRQAQREAEMNKRITDLKLTAEQKEELEAQLEEERLKNASETERAKALIKKAEKEHLKAIKLVTQERDAFRDMYSRDRIQNELTTAALSGENPAVNPRQIVNILRSNTSLVKDETTGKYVTQVKMAFKAEDGKGYVEQIVSPQEAVDKMRSNVADYGNLFKSTLKSGVGGSQSGSSSQKSFSEKSYSELKKEYAERRKRRGR